MKNSFILVLIVFSQLFLTSCDKLLYPIKNNRFEKKENPNIIYESSYRKENFFQLRIKRDYEFLLVKDLESSEIKEDFNRKLTSDYPIKRFRQDTLPQSAEYIYPSTVEETYFYLDKFNSIDSIKTDNSEINFGYAFYFITYPTIDKDPFGEKRKSKKYKKAKNKKRNRRNNSDELSRTVKYFNNSKYLYSNIFRSVEVGYWIKNSKKEILLILRNSKKEIAVFNGIILSDKGGIGLERISHPSRLNNNIIENLEYQNLYKTAFNKKESSSKTIDAIFEDIKSQVSFIELKNVFDLSKPKTKLLFLNIPEKRKFILEIENNEKDIQQFKIGMDSKGNNHFYISVLNNKKLFDYQFKKSSTLFVKELEASDTIN